MPLFPPRHICIVGALAIAAGVESVIGMIANLFGGSLSLDFGFVGIPIGYGILIGRSSSRKWAIFFAVAGILVIGGFGGLVFFEHLNGGDVLPYPDVVYVATEILIWLVCCVYILVILTRRTYREWFDSFFENSASSKSFAWAVGVTSAVLLVSHQSAEWWVERTHTQIYPIRVKVIPFNVDSGEGLNSLTYESDAIISSRSSKPDLPKVGVSIVGGTDGMFLEFSGVASNPVEVTIKSKGFHDTPVTLDKNTADEIRLAMSPIGTIEPDPRSESEIESR